MNYKLKINSGMSFIEILVVIGIFAILGALATQALVLAITGSKKSESLIKIRSNINLAFGIMERQLRNANSVTTCTSGTSITYLDQEGKSTTFSCNNIGVATNGYIASGSAQITATTIDVESCSITCVYASNGQPTSVNISVTADDAEVGGTTNSTVTTSTSVSLRNY